MKHKLKTNQEYMGAIRSGAKTFEIRRDDRGFNVGDVLWLKGWDSVNGVYTDDELKADVTYILREAPNFGLADGFCLMGIKVREKVIVVPRAEYVEDVSSLDTYPGLSIEGVRWSGDHVLPHRSMTIQWSSNSGWGELALGLDKDGAAYCDTEAMSGSFVRALITLFFLEANPEWDPRPKEPWVEEETLQPRNLLEAGESDYFEDFRSDIKEYINRKTQDNG